jgi:hypothetical protein
MGLLLAALSSWHMPGWYWQHHERPSVLRLMPLHGQWHPAGKQPARRIRSGHEKANVTAADAASSKSFTAYVQTFRVQHDPYECEEKRPVVCACQAELGLLLVMLERLVGSLTCAALSAWLMRSERELVGACSSLRRANSCKHSTEQRRHQLLISKGSSQLRGSYSYAAAAAAVRLTLLLWYKGLSCSWLAPGQLLQQSFKDSELHLH